MKTVTENVRTILNSKDQVVAIIRRDPITKKALVYTSQDASVEEIAGLIEQRTDLEDINQQP